MAVLLADALSLGVESSSGIIRGAEAKDLDEVEEVFSSLALLLSVSSEVLGRPEKMLECSSVELALSSEPLRWNASSINHLDSARQMTHQDQRCVRKSTTICWFNAPAGAAGDQSNTRKRGRQRREQIRVSARRTKSVFASSRSPPFVRSDRAHLSSAAMDAE
jgi:hypothetical protein